jgi:hypothetical protein
MMDKKQIEIVKGVGIGMALGGALGLGVGAIKAPGYQRTLKKGFGKAMKAVNSVFGAIS